MQRPLGRMSRETATTLQEEVVRLSEVHPELGIVLAEGSVDVAVPPALEGLAQSVLIEAVRNAENTRSRRGSRSGSPRRTARG